MSLKAQINSTDENFAGHLLCTYSPTTDKRKIFV